MKPASRHNTPARAKPGRLQRAFSCASRECAGQVQIWALNIVASPRRCPNHGGTAPPSWGLLLCTPAVLPDGRGFCLYIAAPLPHDAPWEVSGPSAPPTTPFPHGQRRASDLCSPNRDFRVANLCRGTHGSTSATTLSRLSKPLCTPQHSSPSPVPPYAATPTRIPALAQPVNRVLTPQRKP